MNRPIILLDVDDVLANLEVAYLRVINEVAGMQWGLEDHIDWNWLTHVPVEHHEDILSRVRVEGFCYGLDVLPHTQEAVARMKEFADVYAVTAPWPGHKTWYWERTEWLKDNFGIPVEKVIHTMAKQIVRGDVFIEDKAENLEAWAQGSHICCLAILLDKPYNRSNTKFLRAKSWSQVMELLGSVYGRA